jgi:cytochrome bd ubiquinol oxidase subunit II
LCDACDDGGTYLALKAGPPVADRAANWARGAALILVALFIAGGIYAKFGVEGYRITSDLSHDGPSNPLLKTVVRGEGALLPNFGAHPWMLIAPALVFIGAFSARFFLAARRGWLAFITSAAALLGVIATAGLSAFPFLLPSSLDPNSRLTIWDASSSRVTLLIMLVAVAVFLPIVIAYTAFVYRVLRGRVTTAYVEDNSSILY